MKMAMLTAAVLSMGTMAMASPRTSARRAMTEVPPNLTGSSWIGVAPKIVAETPWLDFRISTGATKPTAENGFLADASITDHKTYRLSIEEAVELASGLRAWIDAPHSIGIFTSSDGPFGLTFTGNAWNLSVEPVIVVSLTVWIEGDRGHVHGGEYAILRFGDAKALAGAIEAWVADPTPQDPSQFLYQRLVQ